MLYEVITDGLENTVRRIIAVTSEPVSGNDLSGTYEGTLWTPMEMEVKQLHRDGWYQCEEVVITSYSIHYTKLYE